MKNKALAAALAALIAQIIFGFSFLFSKTAMEIASPFVLIADRFAVAFIGLTAVMLITRSKVRINKNIWKPMLMALFQPVMYFIFESHGIKLTTSSFSSVMISLVPIVTMISGIFILHEIPSVMQYFFCAMSVGGVVIMTLAGNSDGTVTPFGVLLLFGAVLSAVAYAVATRKISAEFTVFERTYAMTALGAIFFIGCALAENIRSPMKIIEPFAEPQFVISVMYLGILSSVAAFMLLNFANTHLPVAKTTVFSNITTVVSVIAGAVFLHEKLSVWAIISTVMIIVGVMGVQMLDVKKKK